DSFGGGFVIQSFIAYWFSRKFHASPETLGVVFFGIGLLQAGSFQVAVRLAERIGLLRTMVFTHLPSNLLLIAVPFAPTLGTGIASGRGAAPAATRSRRVHVRESGTALVCSRDPVPAPQLPTPKHRGRDCHRHSRQRAVSVPGNAQRGGWTPRSEGGGGMSSRL